MKKSQVSPTSEDGEIEMMYDGGQTAGDEQAKKDKLFQDFRNDVARRIEEYKNNADVDEKSEFNTTEEVEAKMLFLKEANACDKCYMITAFWCSVLFGAGMPGFSFFFGDMINGLGDTTGGNFSTMKTTAAMMGILGFAMMFFSWA